jgi:hypothetical protein
MTALNHSARHLLCINCGAQDQEPF